MGKDRFQVSGDALCYCFPVITGCLHTRFSVSFTAHTQIFTMSGDWSPVFHRYKNNV